jgi:hypothetical protein
MSPYLRLAIVATLAVLASACSNPTAPMRDCQGGGGMGTGSGQCF